MGTHFLEPLVDLHWSDLGGYLVVRLNANRILRRSFSCVCLSTVPHEAVVEMESVLEDTDRI